MGDVVSNQLSATFDSAFKHDYSALSKKQGNSNQTLTQNKTYPNINQNQYYGSYTTMKLPDIKPIVDMSNQVIVDTVTTEPKTNKDKLKSAAIIGGAGIVIGGTTLLLTKGKISKKFTNALGNYAQNISKKIESLTNNPNIKESSALKLFILQKLNKGLMMVRGLVFNITPLKDVLFDKIVSDWLHLKKPCNAITNGFRKLSLSTVKSSYKKAENSLSEMTELFSETNNALKNGSVKKQKGVNKDFIESLDEGIKSVRTAFADNFSNAEIDKRDGLVSNICKNLNNRVYNRVYGNLKNFVQDIKSLTTFLPEEIIAKDKAKFYTSLMDKKRIISNNPRDNAKLIFDAVSKLENTINPTDKTTRELLKNLKMLAESYQNVSGAEEQVLRSNISAQINMLLKKTRTSVKFNKYSDKDITEITSQLNKIGTTLNTDKKGLIEELLTKYKEVLPPEEYQKLKNSAKKATDELNKAVMQEGSEYVDKVRDLTDGSALTDVALSMALPLVSTSVAVSRAETKEKKQSVALKYGIPIVTGAITSTLATVKLVAGGKALALGLASTLITNQICSRIDKKLKEKISDKQITT